MNEIIIKVIIILPFIIFAELNGLSNVVFASIGFITATVITELIKYKRSQNDNTRTEKNDDESEKRG